MTKRGDLPTFTETINDGFGTYRQRWICNPPPKGVPFRVIRQEWDEEMRVRTIYEVRVALPVDAERLPETYEAREPGAYRKPDQP